MSNIFSNKIWNSYNYYDIILNITTILEPIFTSRRLIKFWLVHVFIFKKAIFICFRRFFTSNYFLCIYYVYEGVKILKLLDENNDCTACCLHDVLTLNLLVIVAECLLLIMCIDLSSGIIHSVCFRCASSINHVIIVYTNKKRNIAREETRFSYKKWLPIKMCCIM